MATVGTVGTLIMTLAAGCGDDSCTTCVEDGIRGLASFADGRQSLELVSRSSASPQS